MTEPYLPRLRGRVAYRNRSDGAEWGFEEWSITRGADGLRVMQAHCEMTFKGENTVRDSLISVQPDFHPRDASVRIMRQGVLTGPDGFNVALYQRNSPPFTEFPLGLMSRAFNAMRMVRDQRASVAWYRDRLGFSQAFDQDYRDPAPGPTNFSIPHNLAPTIARCASAMHPVPNGSGRIEIMQFVGFTGKDVSAFAHAPNFGILSVRYPVDRLTAFRTQVEARGVTPAQTGTIAIAGRPTAAFGVRDPDGNLTEFYDSGSKR